MNVEMLKNQVEAKRDVQELRKGKKMPVGTVSHGRKKMPDGSWVPVKGGTVSGGKKKTNTQGVLPKSDPYYDSKRDPVANVEDALDDPSRGKEFVSYLKKKGYTNKSIANLGPETISAFAEDFER